MWVVRCLLLPMCNARYAEQVGVLQGVAWESVESTAVWLDAVASPLQAQLEGFKTRALRAQAPAQRHQYASEWHILAMAQASEIGRLVLSDTALITEMDGVGQRIIRGALGRQLS